MFNKKDLSLAIRNKYYFLSNEVITYRQKKIVIHKIIS